MRQEREFDKRFNELAEQFALNKAEEAGTFKGQERVSEAEEDFEEQERRTIRDEEITNRVEIRQDWLTRINEKLFGEKERTLKPTYNPQQDVSIGPTPITSQNSILSVPKLQYDKTRGFYFGPELPQITQPQQIQLSSNPASIINQSSYSGNRVRVTVKDKRIPDKKRDKNITVSTGFLKLARSRGVKI